MKRALAALALGVIAGLLGPACSESKGGPPESPCGPGAESHAPYCGQPCVAKCGCRSCDDGDPLEVGGVRYRCKGGCFAPSSFATDGGDAAISDAASDANCAEVECAPPAICGQCTAPCGCCACTNGEFVEFDDVPYVCVVNCYTPLFGDGGI